MIKLLVYLILIVILSFCFVYLLDNVIGHVIQQIQINSLGVK